MKPTTRVLAAAACGLLTARALPLSPPSSGDVALPSRVRLRPGFPDDALPISLTMAGELMNPLGISHENNLIVAEDTGTGERVGWAQVRSLGYAGETSADASRFEDDSNGDSSLRVEAQSRRAVEEDVDEEMWEDFEDDPAEFPNGLASLPWTAEYRAASRAAEDRIRRRERKTEMELASRPMLWELSSVYVAPRHRNRGIGSALVRGVLERHVTTKRRGRDVYAMTLAKTVPWYERHGFAVEERIPSSMAMELGIGRAITNVLGEELVCIRTTLSDN